MAKQVTKWPENDTYRIAEIEIDNITVGDDRRPLNQEYLKKLARDIEVNGLRTPITVCKSEDGFYLVSGLHRLGSYKKLDLDRIPAFIVDPDAAETWSITENFLRLNDSYFDTCVAFSRLANLRTGRELHPGGRQPNEKGINKIAREFRMSRSSVSRMLRIAMLDSAVVTLVKKYDLTEKRTFLSALCKLESRAHQIQHIASRMANNSARKLPEPSGKWLKSSNPKRTRIRQAKTSPSPNLELRWGLSGFKKLYDQQSMKRKIAFIQHAFSRKAISKAYEEIS